AVQPAMFRPKRQELEFDAATINFGSDRSLRNVALEAAVVDGWPRQLTFSAIEGGSNHIVAELAPRGKAQRLRVMMEDTAALVRTLTEPLRVAKLPPGWLASTMADAIKIPTLLAGGAMALEGEVWQRLEGPAAKGTFRLENATMIRAPRILQLLSFRRGRDLEKSPLIRRLSVGEWALDSKGVRVKGVDLDGSGLIDRLKLQSINYTFAGGKVAMDGVYFGVGFEVTGTRAEPEIFLKETALLKALILQPDSGFFTDETKAPEKK
ncbi:MAG: hypothetical protein ACREH8_07610, partial [Opitutaceae bacterium]